MATHSSILVWRTPRTEEAGGLQSMGLQRVGQTEELTHTKTINSHTVPTISIHTRQKFLKEGLGWMATGLGYFSVFSFRIQKLQFGKHTSQKGFLVYHFSPSCMFNSSSIPINYRYPRKCILHPYFSPRQLQSPSLSLHFSPTLLQYFPSAFCFHPCLPILPQIHSATRVMTSREPEVKTNFVTTDPKCYEPA